ncbi:hypothetical protein OG470_20045 [Micromonospora sp. NBC_00389]
MLSLDATVVLLTPAVLATTARVGVRPKPHLYACGNLANSASLLLPISNVSDLLAFAVSGLSFTRFAGLNGPAVAGGDRHRVCDLPAGVRGRPGHPGVGTAIGAPSRPPQYAFAVVGGTPCGVRAGQTDRWASAWTAAAGALALAVPRLRRAPGREGVPAAAGSALAVSVRSIR